MKWVESGGTAAANVLLSLTSVCNHAVSKSRPPPLRPFHWGTRQHHTSSAQHPTPPHPTDADSTLFPLKQPNHVTPLSGCICAGGDSFWFCQFQLFGWIMLLFSRGSGPIPFDLGTVCPLHCTVPVSIWSHWLILKHV